MRKRDIVLKIIQETGIKQVVVMGVVQKTFDVIMAALRNGERIELRHFGVFAVKKRKRRIARNPKTGAVVSVPERYKVVFKPGMGMKGIMLKQ
jgi:nucleoid DNA-binding protein